ncbi:hypothetical protein EsH8_X_000002 [Colletotrichum jinshuiense]
MPMETSFWGPQYQRASSPLQLSGGLSTSTFAPTFQAPALPQSSRGTNRPSSGFSTSTYKPTLRVPSTPPPARPSKSAKRTSSPSSSLSASTFVPMLHLPAPKHHPPSSGLSTSTFWPTLQLPSPKRGIAASRFNSHPAPELYDGRASIHPSESASVVHLSRRRLAHSTGGSSGVRQWLVKNSPLVPTRSPPPLPPPPPPSTRPDSPPSRTTSQAAPVGALPCPPESPLPRELPPRYNGNTAHFDQLEASRDRLDGLIASIIEIQLAIISKRELSMINVLGSIQRAIVTGQRMNSVQPLVQELDSLYRVQACEM